MATGMLVNSLVEAFFLPNCANFSELIRTGDLDFALLKPIDTQFLVSFERIDLAELVQVVWAGGLLWYGLDRANVTPTWGNAVMYVLLIGVAVAFFYCLMIALASTSVWLGRNQGLYDFWFYITVFARYPQNFFRTGTWIGETVWFSFSFVIPILLVMTIPSRVVLNQTLEPSWEVGLIAPALTIVGLLLTRKFFQWSLNNYRSASS
jgi:ABC-2 type transport system permease protein